MISVYCYHCSPVNLFYGKNCIETHLLECNWSVFLSLVFQFPRYLTGGQISLLPAVCRQS